ncbi:MAG: EF-P lysine aminoacylase EpmA [Thermodesulfobacteriota bacterium]
MPYSLDRQAAICGNLILRARIISAVRSFFAERGFLEVEVPCRVPAPLPEAHVDAIPADGWFLSASPEDLMKRLLCCGYSRIFTICKAFRRSERGRNHLPEFSILEWYRAEADYRDLMEDCEELAAHVAESALEGGSVERDGVLLDLSRPWPRITVAEAFSRYAEQSADQALAKDEFDSNMAFAIEPALPRNRPVFLLDYPAEKASFARKSAGNQAVAERFELYMAGVEIANAFSELTDPVEQEARFVAENEERQKQGKPVYPEPKKFLQSLGRMPRSAGIALGLDRLVMVLVNAPDIDSVCAFTPEEL